MQKILVIGAMIAAALSVADCAGKGKVPFGKGKAPAPVVTKGQNSYVKALSAH
jgi:hypothetical protein